MSYLDDQGVFRSLEDFVDMSGNPTFLLSCLGPNRFQMVKFGKQTLLQTGLSADDSEGKMIHEFLPARIADTVVANYEMCRQSRETITYTELLDLPVGTRWWRTTLAPIIGADGEVSQILGTSVDISDLVEQAHDDAKRTADLREINERLKVFASRSAHGVRGPLQSVLTLVGKVKEGFLDLGDEKLKQLVECETITTETVAAMGGIVDEIVRMTDEPIGEDAFDLGHMCRDLLALADPDQSYHVTYPQARIRADGAVLQMALLHLIENAAQYAQSRIDVTLERVDDGWIALEISNDGTCSEALANFPTLEELDPTSPMASVIKLISGQGGSIAKGQAPSGCVSVRICLPGQLIELLDD